MDEAASCPYNLTSQREDDIEAKIKHELLKTIAEIDRLTEKVSEMRVSITEMELELATLYNPQLLEDIRQLVDED